MKNLKKETKVQEKKVIEKKIKSAVKDNLNGTTKKHHKKDAVKKA
jgi:hypothetical protein